MSHWTCFMHGYGQKKSGRAIPILPLFPEVTRQALEREEGCLLIVKSTGKGSILRPLHSHLPFQQPTTGKSVTFKNPDDKSKFYLLAFCYCFGFGGLGSALLFVALFLRQGPRLASNSERYACLFLSSSFLSSSSLCPFSQWTQMCHDVALLGRTILSS